MTHRIRRPLAIALGVALALAVLVWAFDWNWVRPSIERHLTSTSGRPVRFDDLKVSLDRHLDLDIRLRGVAIANAPWADTREPMATVGEARFTMTIASIVRREPVVPRLVLVDGRIDLQRQADGLRNWRLTHPDDRGPGHVTIEAIEARRTSFRFVHRGIDLDVVANAGTGTEPGLETLIDFMGTYGGERFGGEVATGPEITLQRTGREFRLRGQMNAAGSHLTVDGRAADVAREAALDGRLHVEGPSLARLRRFLRAPLPDSKPFSIDATLKKARTEYTFAQIQARVGKTALEGELAYDVRQRRPWIEATLRSERAQWDDLQSLLKSGAPPDPDAPKATATARARPLGLDRLNHLDARFDLDIKRLVAAGLPALGGVRFKATVGQGRLAMTDLDIGLANGRATGTFTLDAGTKPSPSAHAVLAWDGVRIEDLVAMPEAKRVTGLADGRIELRAEGDSIAALAASTHGSASANLRQGSVSKRLDAELGLDGMRLLGSLFGADKQVAVRCASVAFDVAGGVAKARRFIVDTATTQVRGTGSIDLRDTSVALTLSPDARQPGLLTLDRSIAVTGTLAAPKARLVDRVDAGPTEVAACGPA